MRSFFHLSLAGLLLLPAGCAEPDSGGAATSSENDDTGETVEGSGGSDETSSSGGSGDGDGDTTATGPGDGDGDPDTGPGDGDGEGDPDTGPGDGDGDPNMGDGDADPDTGDGDGDPDTGDSDGDGVSYSIGATEVTVGEYSDFLDAGIGFGGLPDTCSWKNDYTPNSWNSQAVDDADYPVVGVDWCDAWAFCDWSGERLCGQVGGQAAALADFDDAVNNEWYRACTNGGTLTYPYGNAFEPASCNGVDYGANSLTLVGSIDTCEGGVPGLFDMSGNAWEWTSACANSPNTDDEAEECRRRGGSRFSSADVLRCNLDSTRRRDFRNLNTGLRCCSNL